MLAKIGSLDEVWHKHSLEILIKEVCVFAKFQ